MAAPRWAGIGGLAAALAGFAAACLENIPKPGGPATSLTVTPESSVVAVGDSVALAATARNATGQVLSGVAVTWTGLTPAVATVSAAGVVRTVAPGSGLVVASTGGLADTAKVTVIPRVVGIRIAPAGATLVPGGVLDFYAEGVDAGGAPLVRVAAAWTSSDAATVSVAGDGAATAVRAGAAWVRASVGAFTDSVLVRAVTVRFTAVSAGPYQSTCATGPQGAFCWGYDGLAGNLGIGVPVDAATSPVGVVGGERFVAASAGDAFSCALTADSVPVCWGNGAYGRLGDGTVDLTRATPAPVAGALILGSISAGRRHACGLTAAGAAWCWGGNSQGALGVPLATTLSAVPVAVATERRFVSVGAGYFHTCGLGADSTAWCWGRGFQLGDSVGVTRPEPGLVYGGHRFLSLSVGWNHTCGLATDGLVWCWGYNLAGELGRTTPMTQTIPVSVAGGPAFASVTAGYTATCGLAADGAAYCWGWNNAGQLGTGDTVGGPTPRAVAGGLRFTRLSVGYDHSCGLATDGLLYCWGAGMHGMIGDGVDGGSRLTPSPVMGQTPGAPARGSRDR